LLGKTPYVESLSAQKIVGTKETMKHSIASSKMFVKSFRTKTFVKNLAQFGQIINSYLISQNLSRTKVEASLLLKLMESPCEKGEKTETITSKFSPAHNNTMSSPLEGIVEDGCSVLENNEFNLEAPILTPPREIKKIIKNLKNSKPPGSDI
jgi:hypothetical protein